jgi:hypothetical protein
MSVAGICPIVGCSNKLGETRRGDRWLMCRKHWSRVPLDLQLKIWRAYRSWQRLERLREVGPTHLKALALAMSHYIDVRNDAIRLVAREQAEQMEMAQ